MKPKINLVKTAIITGMVSYPLGGFIAGLVLCTNCNGIIGNTFGRALVGLIIMILSSITFGFPPKNEGGVGEPFNIWPYILICWLVLFLLYIFLQKSEK